jgi:uncharacterized protein YciI
MYFVALCLDKPDHLRIRTANRDAHLAWLKSLTGRILVAGPFLSEADGSMIGSMLIAEADGIDGARALFAQDPYAKAGLFASTEIRPWKWVLGAPA